MNVLRTLAFRFALAVPRPKCEPYIYRLDTLKELDAAAMTATTALCELADAARYADTDGYQADDTRTNWPWRDWVVGAFNANMLFDRLVVKGGMLVFFVDLDTLDDPWIRLMNDQPAVGNMHFLADFRNPPQLVLYQAADRHRIVA